MAMMKTSHSSGLFLAVLLCSVLTYAQETETDTNTKQQSLYFMVAGSVGNFSPNSGKQFTDVYSNRTMSKNIALAIGARTFALIGKYREFSATGRSVVTNIDIAGKAEWKQKLYMGGIRFRGDDMPFYLDLLFVSTRADETISTVSPVIAELTAMNTKESRGFGGAVGLTVKLAGMLGIFAEAEYSKMSVLEINLFERPSPELGGLNLNAGIQLSF